MQKVIYSTQDIIEEFLTRAYMKSLHKSMIDMGLKLIMQEKFQLVRTIKYMGPKRIIVNICEWYENGVKDSDEWLRPCDNFISSIAHGYIIEVTKKRHN